jgi:hypothetical protein
VSEDREADVRRDLSELQDAVLSDWVTVASHATNALRAMEGTLSWRVTKPLRVVRILQTKIAQVGPSRAVQIATAQIASRMRPGR